MCGSLGQALLDDKSMRDEALLQTSVGRMPLSVESLKALDGKTDTAHAWFEAEFVSIETVSFTSLMRASVYIDKGLTAAVGRTQRAAPGSAARHSRNSRSATQSCQNEESSITRLPNNRGGKKSASPIAITYFTCSYRMIDHLNSRHVEISYAKQRSTRVVFTLCITDPSFRKCRICYIDATCCSNGVRAQRFILPWSPRGHRWSPCSSAARQTGTPWTR
jgi:hypothetical protein